MNKKMMIIFSAVLIGFIALSFKASAHAELVSSTPAKGATVEKSISDIKLQFGERVEKVVKMDLKNSNGKVFSIHKPDSPGKNLTVHINQALPSGTYTLKWKLISIDGHAVSQELSFNVGSKEVKQQADPSKSKQTQKHIKSQETPVFLMMFIFLMMIIVTAVYLMIKNKRRK